ncbi:DnaJ domain-containing protein [Faecalicatena fissicatena]|uniref:DnaJ domain-containing protein n=1 Tax=Faecalicatena fissicatena TaxID=290055 RepID=A0ABS2EC55_9FIRM|nr:DnaJ domain-containing protein [Faecalicatena fissicatena]HIX99904.1 DnaJ domain-containing protein [Candidatus Dorea intestinigallinarum]
MTREEACRILGVSPGAAPDQIKKKYRQLMHRLHPDAGPSEEDLHLAWQVNAAYALLKGIGPGDRPSQAGPEAASGVFRRRDAHHSPHRSSARRSAWDAPVNRHAYRERDILCRAEDSGGEVIGTFTAARGRYFWTTEEDFPLFLRSIYLCGKELLDEVDASLGRASSPSCRSRFHADLTYLLAQQYIDATSLLKELAAKTTSDREGQDIYYFPAMLETKGQERSGLPGSLPAEAPLFPAGVRDHRLFLKDSAGQEAGYLSFSDDRLYYVLVPLFEQRRVLVRLRAAGEGESASLAAGKGAAARKKRGAGYRRLHLWLKFKKEEDSSRLPESLSLQISQLLEHYRASLS